MESSLPNPTVFKLVLVATPKAVAPIPIPVTIRAVYFSPIAPNFLLLAPNLFVVFTRLIKIPLTELAVTLPSQALEIAQILAQLFTLFMISGRVASA